MTRLDIFELLKREKFNLSVVNNDGCPALHLLCIHYQGDYMLMIDIMQDSEPSSVTVLIRTDE